MKIRINENETYELNINEGIYSVEEFLGILERLTEVLTTLTSKQLIKKTPIGVGKLEIETRGRKKGEEPPKNLGCPNCKSNNIVRDGITMMGDGTKRQRWTCKDCGRGFREDLGVKLDTKEEFLPKPRIKRGKQKISWNNRDEVVNILKIHYFGTQEEKDTIAESKDVSWLHIMKGLAALRRRFNISPEEVGIKEFPTLRKRKLGEVL